ncbi:MULTISPECIES: hypothetical protein [Enterobacteriaceae]|uniref:hypothetical protein n=1 Tax=Enterobacteriaceae TaxID=543 RepID=UPI0013D0349B|nr:MULTISPECIES: hypothetical protein [Enterobacteriaceae]MCD9415448.1 hypothetical protein [Klebsiella pneumoniae]
MIDTNGNPLNPRITAAVHVANEMLNGDIFTRSELQSFGIDSTHTLDCMRQCLHIMPTCRRGDGETYWYLSAWVITAINDNLPKYRRYVAFRRNREKRFRQLTAVTKAIIEAGYLVPDDMANELMDVKSTIAKLRGAK